MARSAEVGLADAVVDAVVGHYAAPQAPEALLMITTSPALRACYVGTVGAIEGPLAEAVSRRCPGMDQLSARVLAAGVAAAAGVALDQWLRSAGTPASMPGFVVPAGSLAELMRAALRPLVPALDAAPGCG